jgi:hypothetical protein
MRGYFDATYDRHMSRIPWQTILSNGAQRISFARHTLRTRRTRLGQLAMLTLFVVIGLPLLILMVLALLVVALILGVLALLRIRIGQWVRRWGGRLGARNDGRENVRVIRRDAAA